MFAGDNEGYCMKVADFGLSFQSNVTSSIDSLTSSLGNSFASLSQLDDKNDKKWLLLSPRSPREDDDDVNAKKKLELGLIKAAESTFARRVKNREMKGRRAALANSCVGTIWIRFLSLFHRLSFSL